MAENNDINVQSTMTLDASQPTGALDSISKQIDDLLGYFKKFSTDVTTIISKQADQTEKNVKKVKKELTGILELEDKLKVLFNTEAYRDSKTGNFRNPTTGRFVSDETFGLDEYLKQQRNITRYLKAQYQYHVGINNLLSQQIYKAREANLVYGSSPGIAALEFKLKSLESKLNFQAENADLLLQDQAIRQQNQLEKAQERVRRNNMTQAERDAEDVEKYQERVQNRLRTTQLQVMANYTVINKLTSAYKALINYTVQYDEELHQLQAISAMSNTSLAKTRETIESVAVSTEFTSLELAKASTVLAQAGLSATQIQGTLGAIAKLATATGTDLATSTDVITSTMNIYEMQVSEAEHVTNALTTAMNESKATIPGFQTAIQYAGNTASQLGMSFEETTAAISAATQAGVRSKSMLGTGLRAVLTEFLKPTPKLIAQLEKVGLTLGDIDVKTKGYVGVLKTLRQAGFGVEEAYRGMERRGAAFLVAQLKQTDFMDDLRVKMAGSTAATKANDTQMQALAKQIKNFQNVMGTAATQGLAPFIDKLSSLLKLINAIGDTKLGRGLFSILEVGLGSMATVKSFQLLNASFKGIAGALGLITGGSRIDRLREMVKIGYRDFTGWEKLSYALKSITVGGWVGIIAAITSGLYQAADAMGLFTSENDKLLEQFEEAKGKQEELKTASANINDYLTKLVTNREKYNDPMEVRILAQEIVSKIPGAVEHIDVMTASVKDLYEALHKLKNINAQDISNNAADIANKSTAPVIDAAQNMFSGIRGAWGNVKIEDAEKFVKGMEQFDSRYKTLTGKSINWGEIFFGNYYDDKPSTAAYVPTLDRARNFNEKFASSKDQAGYIQNTLSLWGTGIDPEQAGLRFTKLLTDIVEEVKAGEPTLEELKALLSNIKGLTAGTDLEQFAPVTESIIKLVNSLIDAKITGQLKEITEDWDDAIKKVSSSIQETTNTVKDNLTLIESRGVDSLKQEDYTGLEEQYQTISTLSKVLSGALNPKEAEDVKKLLKETGAESADLLGKIKDKDYLNNLGAHLSETELFPMMNTLIEVMARFADIAVKKGWAFTGMEGSILEDIQKANLKQIERAKSKSSVNLYREQTEKIIKIRSEAQKSQSDKVAKDQYDRELALINASTYASEEQIDAAKAGAEARYKEKLAKNAESQKDSVKTQTDLLMETVNARLSNLSRGEAKIDPLNTEFKLFFDNLDTSIKKITTTYREAEKALDQALAKQQGITEATERYYGSSSVMAQAASIDAKKLEESQIYARTRNLEVQRASLNEQLKAMMESPLFAKVSNYKNTMDAYESALASGDTSAALKYQNQLSKASANEKKMASKYDELTKSINELDETIEKNNTIINELKRLGNQPLGDQISGGIGAAAKVYNNQVESQGLNTVAGSTAYLASGVIDEIDSGFTTMFKNIVSNSKSASEAFKDFGRQVLETIRDIAIQMAVKQGLNALFSSFAGGFGDTGDITGNNLQVGQSSGNLTYLGHIKQATGGLVNGPIKNRDSVNAQLMPGEYVLKKSAVDVVGRDYLDSLNNNANAALSATASAYNNSLESTNTNTDKGTGGVVNVYVVGQEQQQSMTPSDVLVTITQDMLTGGQTKRLVKSIAMGTI